VKYFVIYNTHGHKLRFPPSKKAQFVTECGIIFSLASKLPSHPGGHECKPFKHCSVIEIQGRVDSSTAPQLTKTLNKVTDDGHFKLVLDMSGLEYMSSAGFRALLAAQRNCKRYNRGEVALASVPPRIQEALELAGFTELFKTYDDALAAVGSF